MRNNKLKELSLLFMLFERVKDGLKDLVDAFGKFVKMAGTELVCNPTNDVEKDQQLVQNLMG